MNHLSMMSWKRRPLWTLAIVMMLGLGMLPRVSQSAPQLPNEVTKVLRTHKIPSADLSLYVSKVAADAPTLALNAAAPRNPASVMKLLTSLMALDTLGPDFHWRTEAYIRGSLKQGILNGDLILKGYGDPVLTPERFWQFLYGLRERGLREIRGSVIIDGSYFATPMERRSDFDGRPQRAYNALPHALSLNFQATQLHLVPDQGSATVRAFTTPPLANLEIHNQMRLVTGSCQGQRSSPLVHLSEQQSSATLELQGEYSANCPEWSKTYLVMDPAEHLGGAFSALWKELGGELKGAVKAGLLPPRSKRFHSIESPPLAEVIRDMNKFSNNLMSRMLLLTVAAEGQGAPATASLGQGLIKAWLGKWQIPAGIVRVSNGSGLAREAQISTEIIGRMLQAAYASPLMPEFISSLPLVGIDGTMRKRLRNSELVGRAHIKTGTLNNVSAMAGYVQDHDNQRWVVALIINHQGLQSWQGKQVQDAVLRWVYQSPEQAPWGSSQIAAAAVMKCEGGKNSGACKPSLPE